MNNKNIDNQNPPDLKGLEHLKRQMAAAHAHNEHNMFVRCVDAHIVFYDCTHTDGAILHLP